MAVIEKINSPSDLKKLGMSELNMLASEIRQLIIDTVAETGGHLASNLGVVELTIALHYVFDAPHDKIIWDVGHQCYTHKILTGRREAFRTLRKRGGISGFPKREESVFDAFNTGHSGTSISAALGMAKARCFNGDDYKVVAVIGDGSIATGMAFEGLNHAGTLGEDIIVVLNDNEMSISHNVGALSAYLSRIMTGTLATKFREEIKSLLKSIPGLGTPMYHWAKQAEEVLKGMISPGIIFEELGFKYVGPLQGHRLDHLIETLRNVKKFKKPTIVHVVTTKGKGYPLAEGDPVLFHGIEPADPCMNMRGTGDAPEEMTFTKAFGQAMVKLAREDERIVAITAAMPDGTGLGIFSEAFPRRFFDVGICEQHGVTFAAGLASQGLKPVVAIYSTFMQRAYDQIIQDVCLPRLPVVLVMDRGGLVGQDGETHHGMFDISFLRPIPNIVIMAPKDENELQHMLKTAIDLDAPVAIRYPRGGSGTNVSLDDEFTNLPVGRAEIIKDGKDAVIIGVGPIVNACLDAAIRLQKEGWDIGVINGRFIKPIDEETIAKYARKTRFLITAEEGVLKGGFGSAVLEVSKRLGLRRTIKTLRIGLPDRFISHGTQEELRREFGLDASGIYSRVKDFILSHQQSPRIRLARKKAGEKAHT